MSFFTGVKQLEINFEIEAQKPKDKGEYFDDSYSQDFFAHHNQLRVEFNDIWQVGKQVIVCADASNLRAWEQAITIQNSPVNLVFTSPPYASQRRYDEKSEFKPIPPDRYVSWFKPFQQNIQKYLASDGSFCINIKEHCDRGTRHLYVSDLKIAMVRQWGWRWIDELIWHKNGFPGYWEHRLRDDFERIFHFAVGKPKLIKDAIALNRGYSGTFWSGFNSKTQGLSASDGNTVSKKVDRVLPGNVLKMPVESSQLGHPAAFPIGLPDFFIKAFTLPADVVCDPFLGSGTALAASAILGRRGIGFEISPKYCQISLNRLSQLMQQTPQKIGKISE